MARNRFNKKHNHKKAFTLPLAVIAGFAPPIMRAADAWKAGTWRAGVKRLTQDMTGFNTAGVFTLANLQYGLLPVTAGILVHKAAGMLGINRALAGAGIPFLRI